MLEYTTNSTCPYTMVYMEIINMLNFSPPPSRIIAQQDSIISINLLVSALIYHSRYTHLSQAAS